MTRAKPNPRHPTTHQLPDHPIDGGFSQVEVVVVGAGIAGILAGVLLPAKVPGVKLRILERNNDVGGVWLTNIYPGVKSDIPADVYQSTFAPSQHWTCNYPPGAEIQSYWKGIAERYGVTKHITYNTTVRKAVWCNDRNRWAVHTVTNSDNHEAVQYADIIITATGTFSEPEMPNISGMDVYRGRIMHSSLWDPSVDITGKRLALIGNGAAGLQILPELHKNAAHVDHYIRSPTWISPSFGGEEKLLSQGRQAVPREPDEYNQYRKGLENRTYSRFSMLFKDQERSKQATDVLTAYMRRRLGADATEDDFARALIPSFAPNCRRLTPAPGYLEALKKPNVSLIMEPISGFSDTGVVTSDGTDRACDVIICSTGADVSYRPTFSILNGKGVDLRQAWSEGFEPGFPDTYLGMAAAEFPNLFFVTGPNSIGQPGPLVYMIERQIVYLAKVLRKMVTQGILTMCPTQAAVDDFREYCDAYFPLTVMSDACSSWYNGRVPNGRILALWPGSASHADAARSHVRWEDFEYTYRGAAGNRFGYFGNGWTEKDVEAAADPGNVPDFASYLSASAVMGDLDLSSYLE
ncbi:FAD/NAD(P)-binding domain-containing protein [Trichoderma pleuroticola]